MNNETIRNLKEDLSSNGIELVDLVNEWCNCSDAEIHPAGDIYANGQWLDDTKKAEFIDWIEDRN